VPTEAVTVDDISAALRTGGCQIGRSGEFVESARVTQRDVSHESVYSF